MKRFTIRLTGRQHELLFYHLFPGDGKEAVAVALCGRRRGDLIHALCVHEVHPISYDQCPVRAPDAVGWSTQAVLPLLERASKENLALLKLHSHPGGLDRFSSVDDKSDADFFASVHGWTDSEDPHASAIMLPNRKILARAIMPDGTFAEIDQVAVAGDDLHFWRRPGQSLQGAAFAERHAQLFGEDTITRLQRLSVAVVGCSGTGSPVTEMLARLGVGRLVLVDPDHVEERNLNRILNATREDAALGRLKVDVLARAVAKMGLGTSILRIPENVATAQAVRAIAECDVVFGCMDGAFGRSILNRIGTFYNLPYFDLGVALEADGQGGISEAIGAVHFIQPDGSSLRDRRVYTTEQVQAEGLRLTSPDEYRRQVRERYIHGVQEDRPAVISVNMQIAAIAVNEFLARLHPYRTAQNNEFATVRMSFLHGEQLRSTDGIPVPAALRLAGLGDVVPLLHIPMIQDQ
jgi:hypothetical protein